MKKRQIKEHAQDEIMHSIVGCILATTESNENQQTIDEMKKQAIRVARFFGYNSWHGLFDDNIK